MKNNIIKDFSKYVSLNILGSLGVSFYILADTFFISKAIGANGLTALNFAIVIFSLIFGFGLMVGMGSAIRFSISTKKDKAKDTSFTYALIWWLIASVVCLICAAFFVTPISKLLGADEVILPLTTVYLRIIFCFGPFFIMNNILLAFVRNDNRPDLAMISMFVSSVSNVILDYVFLFILGWGMFGAAFATCVSPIISIMLLSTHILKKKNTFHINKIKIKLKSMLKICSLGATFFISEVSVGIALFAFNMIILSLQGNIGVAAYGVVANIAIVAASIFSGISQGSQPLLSKYYSHSQMKNAQKVLKYATITSLGFAVGIIFITSVFSSQIVAIFNEENDATLTLLANEGMKLYFIGYFFASVNILLSCFFSAVSKPKLGIIISVSRSLVVLIPVVFIMSALFEMKGVWLSFLVTEIIVSLGSAWCVLKFFKTNK